LANWLGGTSFPLSLWFTVANGVEVAIAFLLVRTVDRTPRSNDAFIPDPLRLLLYAGLVAPLVSATLAASGLKLLAGASFSASWFDWYFTAALGMLIVAPLGVSVTREDWRRLTTGNGAGSALACAVLVSGATAGVFLQNEWPVLFLITPAILRAAYLFRALGAAAGVVLAALIAVPLTQTGHGPLSLLQSSGPHDRQFLLQLFLLSQSLIALAIAAALEERDALRRALETRERTAVEAAGARSRLLTGVAHEIRTPLNAILGLGELLGKSETLSVRERRLIESMVGASGQLRGLANDLLDRARIESGALILAPSACDPAVLADEIVAEARLAPEAKGVVLRVTATSGALLWADPERTRQILRNLLSNAIKYAGEHGPIIVRAIALGAVTRLEVCDRGPGIALAHQQEVFEPFAQIGARSATGKSAGVGLSLVKMLAQAQGGSVGFASAPYVETRFWVDLPAEPPPGVPAINTRKTDDLDPDEIFGSAPEHFRGD
jgi:signal transduction histidine kinase